MLSLVDASPEPMGKRVDSRQCEVAGGCVCNGKKKTEPAGQKGPRRTINAPSFGLASLVFLGGFGVLSRRSGLVLFGRGLGGGLGGGCVSGGAILGLDHGIGVALGTVHGR